MKSPFDIIEKRHITEKARTLGELQNRTSNRSLARCKSPKYVFLVSSCANKAEIASAVEEIYREKNVKVTKVNTLNVKGKTKRRGRGREGMTSTVKKAIVTLQEGDSID